MALHTRTKSIRDLRDYVKNQVNHKRFIEKHLGLMELVYLEKHLFVECRPAPIGIICIHAFAEPQLSI